MPLTYPVKQIIPYFLCVSFHFALEVGSVYGQVSHLKQPVYDEDGQIKFFPRIVGGRRAHENEFNGLVSIQTWKGEHICGGTLIQIGNKSQILTAAHCVMDSKKHLYPRLLVSSNFWLWLEPIISNLNSLNLLLHCIFISRSLSFLHWSEINLITQSI